MAESSGIFTFPSTGYWSITFNQNWYSAGYPVYLAGYIFTTTNDSTYVAAAEGRTWSNGGYGTAYSNAMMSYLFEVTDTANCKCRFDCAISAGTNVLRGTTDVNQTYMTFIKLADI
jgi:hypothetical protein